ncbi:MAG: insulinase family protein [Muribaculaceae bacterium]|nr:insulinase family protein [Muribaculaceae bacterium]
MRHRKINEGIVQAGPMRLAYRHAPSAAVEYCGAVVLAGSRNDGPAAPGLAHFVEHTIFKGTQRRSSWHINNRMERVGGELNAYTTKEETIVYTAAPAGNLNRSFDLIADLCMSSRFPDAELDKERDVVADEINSYLDMPSDAVFDDFEDLLFAGTTLGHNILGNTEALATFDSRLCRQYLSDWYTAPNMAIFYYGSATPARVAKTVESAFAGISVREPERPAETIAKRSTFDICRERGIHQAHTVMGCLTAGAMSDERFALALLTNILGGPGMNSRLNISLRERRGLVYSVDASASLFTDCGEFAVYFGCDPGDVDRCKDLVNHEIADMASHPLTERALAAAKKQYIGQLAVAGDNRENSAIALGRAARLYGHISTAEQTASAIEAITADQLADTAKKISQLSTLTLR